MVKVTVGKAEDPWCEIELTEEDVEDWKSCHGDGGQCVRTIHGCFQK